MLQLKHLRSLYLYVCARILQKIVLTGNSSAFLSGIPCGLLNKAKAIYICSFSILLTSLLMASP